jgi:hypothetical protein
MEIASIISSFQHSKVAIIVQTMIEAGVHHALLKLITETSDFDDTIILQTLLSLIKDFSRSSVEFYDLFVSLNIFAQLVKVYRPAPEIIFLILSELSSNFPIDLTLLSPLEFSQKSIFKIMKLSCHTSPIVSKAILEANIIPKILDMILFENDLDLIRMACEHLQVIFVCYFERLDSNLIHSFGSRISQDNNKMEIFGTCILNSLLSGNLMWILHCPLIPSFLNRIPLGNDEHLLHCLLEILKNAQRHQRYSIDWHLLQEHLNDSGLIPYLMESLVLRYLHLQTSPESDPLAVPLLIGEIVERLQQLMRSNNRYWEQVMEFPIPSHLKSCFLWIPKSRGGGWGNHSDASYTDGKLLCWPDLGN